MLWDVARKRKLSPSAITLFFALVQISIDPDNNWDIVLGEKDCSNVILKEMTHLSTPTLIQARKELAEAGLLSFKAGVKNASSPTYHLLLLSLSEAETTISILRSLSETLRSLSGAETSGAEVSETETTVIEQSQNDETETSEAETSKQQQQPLEETTWYCTLMTPDYERQTCTMFHLSVEEHERYARIYLLQKAAAVGGIAKMESIHERTIRIIADFQSWIPKSPERSLTAGFMDFLEKKYPNRDLKTAIEAANIDAIAAGKNIVNWQAQYTKYAMNQRTTYYPQKQNNGSTVPSPKVTIGD